MDVYFFGLSTHDFKTITTEPQPLATRTQLENLLRELESIRSETIQKMSSRINTLVVRTKYKSDLVLVESSIEGTF